MPTETFRGAFETAMTALGLAPRVQQERLVEIVREATAVKSIRFVQAGTGTGKSYVLLSEAVAQSRASGLPTLVVCPTNMLIDQYVKKDGPAIAEVLGARVEYVKGRSHYVCANSVGARASGVTKDAQVEWFSRLTSGGELEWTNLGLDDRFGCPGSKRCKRPCFDASHCSRKCDTHHEHRPCDCPWPCGIMLARDRAASAEIVITNAHLLVWDARIRGWSDGMFGLLPERGALFVDECHELESIGRDVFSIEIAAKSRLWTMWRELATWKAATEVKMLKDGVSEIVFDGDDPDIQMLVKQAEERLLQYDPESDEYERLEAFVDFATPSKGYVQVAQLGGDDSELSLHKRCVDLSWFYGQLLSQQPSVLTSGTIPSSDRRRLGVRKASLDLVGHPFDYSRSKLYLSSLDVKRPSDYSKRVAIAVKAIQAVHERGGGTLMLFTSWKDLDEVSTRINHALPTVSMWVQGREQDYVESGGSLRDDIDEFRQAGSGVLCGVRSLFTGLDIPGPALSQVIIWKLPFAVPTAEVQAVQTLHGRSTYTDQMIMQLVQGIGRLVRSTSDTGNVLVMDGRARSIDFGSNHMTHHLAEFTRI